MRWRRHDVIDFDLQMSYAVYVFIYGINCKKEKKKFIIIEILKNIYVYGISKYVGKSIIIIIK